MADLGRWCRSGEAMAFGDVVWGLNWGALHLHRCSPDIDIE